MTRSSGICDIQAVVLAGPGHRLAPLVNERGSPSLLMPKCLLPIANKPMLYYTLNWLHQSGITDVLVVSSASSPAASQRIAYYLNNVYEGPKVELVELSSSKSGGDGPFGNLVSLGGSTEALWSVKDRLRSDFLVVGCDLITDYPLVRLVEQHRKGDQLCTALMVNDSQQQIEEEDAFFAGFDPEQRRLLLLAKLEDIENEELRVKMSLLTAFPRLLIRKNLLDAHCYLFRRAALFDPSEAIFDSAEQRRRLGSLRHDLLPWLVRHQLKDGRMREDRSCQLYLIDSLKHPQQSLQQQQYYCLRANTLRSYAEANRLILQKASSSCSSQPPIERLSQAAEVHPRAQVGPDCVVGAHTTIGERSQVKKTVVGNGTLVGVGVKLVNSVIMDHVQVGDGCRLEGVVIGCRAIISERACLKDTFVAGGYVVLPESNIKNEILGGDDEEADEGEQEEEEDYLDDEVTTEEFE